MSLLPQHRGDTPSYPTPWIENAVFGFDRWLRRRQGVFEYSDDPHCIFRIQRAQAEEHVILSDGLRIVPGSPVINLHLWNEHMPLMSADGATVGWARHACRSIECSLRQLAYYVEEHREFDDVRALRADMRLGTTEQSAQLVRLSARYGFEAASQPACSGYLHGASLHGYAQNVLIFFLVLATNPVAVGTPVLRRDHKLVYLPRASLERRYGRARRTLGMTAQG